MSFFLYIYAVKLQNTILLFFAFTINLLANPTAETNRIKENISSTIVSNQDANTGALVAPAVTNDANGGVATSKGSLNSILGYSILIFFSVLIIILVDNRKLQRRYKQLASDFKSKEPIL